MNMPGDVCGKMEHIQNVFLGVQDSIRDETEVAELIALLDTEPPLYRSVAYESGSMIIGLRDLSKGTRLHEWKKFYALAGKVHSFHVDIGLGWAYAKKEVLPDRNLELLHPLMRWMVFDGMGYYNGLFRGRRTIKHHLVPDGIEGEDLKGYDQGLGRRLWYMANGEVIKVTSSIQTFPSSRHQDLWRGVGIACGYVGGNAEGDLELLLHASGDSRKNLCTGIALAAISRSASDSITPDIETACKVLCKMTLKDIESFKTQLDDTSGIETQPPSGHLILQLESEFSHVI
jgi:hypothetical protein